MRKPKLVALVIAAITLLALGSASRLTVSGDVLVLMPDGNPAIEGVRRLNEEEGGINLAGVAVAGRPENTGPFMRELQAKLVANTELVDYALYDVDPDLAWELGVINLDPELVQELDERLQGALALGPAIANPFIAARLLDLGPMSEQLQAADARGALLTSTDLPGVERLLVRATGPAPEMEFCRAFVSFMDQTIDEMDPEAHGVTILWKGGAYHYNVEDYEGIVGDMKWTAVLSVVLVLVLLLGALREVRVLFMLFTPLLVGAIWTFGFAGVAIGQLNNFTAVFGAVLVGLGIDFAIHLYSRYREERGGDGALMPAVVKAWDATGPPCAAAAITSTGGFCALLFAQFKGFSQLGMLLAFGVLVCLTNVLVLMPVLIVWREKTVKPWRKRLAMPAAITKRVPTYTLAPAVLMGLMLVTVGLGFIAPGIGFEQDLSNLKGEGRAYAELGPTERKLVKATYAAVIATYPDAESLQEGEARLEAKIAAGEMPHLGRVISINDVLPADQEARLAALEDIRALSEHENYPLLPASIRSNLEVLDRAELTPKTADDLPHALQHVLGADGGKHRLLVFPGGNVWDLREVSVLKEDLEGFFAEEGVPVAGEYLAVGALAKVIQRDAPVVGVAAILLVWLGTFVSFTPELIRGGGFIRFLRRSSGAMIVLVLGMIWGAGALVMADVKVSLFNMVGIPILLGIGVDVVIHLLHRLAQEGPGRVAHVLSTTGWASGLSALTTVLSFASLSFAYNQGIADLGRLVLVGLTTVTVAAFLIVPFGWMTMWKITGDAPADAQK